MNMDCLSIFSFFSYSSQPTKMKFDVLLKLASLKISVQLYKSKRILVVKETQWCVIEFIPKGFNFGLSHSCYKLSHSSTALIQCIIR